MIFTRNILWLLFFNVVFTEDLYAQSGEWVELINGKNFIGWKASENKETWSVADGMFQADGKRSHLWYEGEYLKNGFKNFEIDVLVKTFRLTNSGIYFHTKYQEKGWPDDGFEIQINNTHVGEGNYLEFKRIGSLYGIRNIYKSFSQDGKWIHIRARVENNRVQIWCDSIKTVDYIQPQATGNFIKPLGKGTFCLQGHDELSKVQFKSFKVRKLPDVDDTKPYYLNHGSWYEVMQSMLKKNFVFIDLNPKQDLSVKDLVQSFYATGINTAIVKRTVSVNDFKSLSGVPLFYGLKISSDSVKRIEFNEIDYVIGESTNLSSAISLLESGIIDIWSDRGKVLNIENASQLLAIANFNSVAIEIDNIDKTPSIEVLKIAKAKGLKFSFSGLVPDTTMNQSQYIFEVINQVQLDYKDIFIPKL